jgi:hypothetical protein
MATPARVKAAVARDLAKGMTVRAAAKKHGVSVGTASALNRLEHAEPAQEGRSVSEVARKRDFDALLDEFLAEAVAGLIVWAKLIQDVGFVKRKPMAAHELGKTVFDRAERILSAVRPPELRGDSGEPAEPAVVVREDAPVGAVPVAAGSAGATPEV